MSTNKKVYLNYRYKGVTETVDEFEREKGQSNKEFNNLVNKMIIEYKIAGINVYRSSRKTKYW